MSFRAFPSISVCSARLSLLLRISFIHHLWSYDGGGGKREPVHHGPSRRPVFPTPADAARALRPSRQYAAAPARREGAPIDQKFHDSATETADRVSLAMTACA